MPFSQFELDPVAIELALLAPPPQVLELDPAGMVCRLIRLDTDNYVRLRRASIPIKPDYGFLLLLMANARRKDTALNLAQTYIALRCLFGETSEGYDDYKGSFAFPLFLHLQKGSHSYPYLLRIRDHKGSLEFDFRRIKNPDDIHHDHPAYHDPLAEEFSREEINSFILYFNGFLKGYFSVVGKEQTQFFYRSIAACLAVYGCRDGQFFEQAYEDEEEYWQAIKELQQHESYLRHRTDSSPAPASACF
ncbi:MAG: hypothetical protein ACKO4U_03475 [Caldilinea sp.]|jgi:hypothetical protein